MSNTHKTIRRDTLMTLYQYQKIEKTARLAYIVEDET